MSALRAATIRGDDARAYLIAKLEAAAGEIRSQADRVKLGETFDARRVHHRMEAVEEAREILAACDENIRRILRAGVA